MEFDDTSVVIIADDGYQTLELWYPKLRLEEAGCTVEIAAPDGVTHESGHGYDVEPDLVTANLRADDYDAVVLPGGIHSAERLRNDADTTDFIAEMEEDGKIVAAVGHAGWILASADVLGGRTVAAMDAVADDMENAGAEPGSDTVVVDDGLVTASGPDELPAFLQQLLGLLEERSG